ncbi:oocyte-secreted protein 2-like [Pteronotus mesoamericanus]|uniref:oocyte-secreted protein 2-like n=1 Tax=Pteronotus mesoamericanus TaxID=1884717 RepID=UPI0023EB1BB7|nr:oocyte-secreted protein 2-like [Pteronotus parnellii mesoamericanus]
MKVSVALEVLALLAASMWPCADNVLVKIACSLDWMMVQVTPYTYCGHQYILAEELYLGLGCPVTWIETYAYHFIYPISDCGIRTQVVSEHTLILQSELYYNPRGLHWSCQMVPLQCSVSRKSVWLTPVSTDEIKSNLSPFIADFEATAKELGLLCLN